MDSILQRSTRTRIAIKYILRRAASIIIPAILLYYPSFHLPTAGQISSGGITGSNLNHIQTSVPFLTIAPDAVSSSMGDAGVASSPDVHSQHWNAAKYAFTDTRSGISATVTPWLRNLPILLIE